MPAATSFGSVLREPRGCCGRGEFAVGRVETDGVRSLRSETHSVLLYPALA